MCGQVSSHPEAFGHRFHIYWGLESLVLVTILTTTAPRAGNAILERLGTAAITSPQSDLGPC